MRTLLVGRAVVTGRGRVGDAVLIDDTAVVDVGTSDDLTRHRPDRVKRVEGVIVPGFRDAHLHLVPYAAMLYGCSLKSATDIEDVVTRLRRYAATVATDRPVVAVRADDETVAERRLPTRHDLDRVASDRPVVTYRYCGHIAAVNSAALRAAGIDAVTPDPDGGTIDRGPDGAPTGVLRETAMELLGRTLTRTQDAEPAMIVDAAHRLAGLGITSVGAMIGYGDDRSAVLDQEVRTLTAVAPHLPIRVGTFAITDDPTALEDSKRLIDAADGLVRWLGVKRFSDGSLGGHTAAMDAPFCDRATSGTLRLTNRDVAIVRHALALGGMAAIHAIGDRAVGAVIDVFEDLVGHGADPTLLRVEHVSVGNAELFDRFSDVGVHAVVQPAFLASETDWLETRLGADRLRWTYAFRSMIDRDIPLAGSSDSTVEPPDPLWGMAAAMDRCGLVPKERVTGVEALRMFTDGGAAALREPVPLSPGSPADLAILDVDPTTATADEIRNGSVWSTWVDGTELEIDRTLPTWVD
ncbi:MAG: amidohydrolase [Acidimicrobiia bacterium]|nr:amidohydrolase [Acidimicrobiia bacterium]